LTHADPAVLLAGALLGIQGLQLFALLNMVGKLNLLSCGEQRDPADGAEIPADRIGTQATG
jgi:hypothetical protein